MRNMTEAEFRRAIRRIENEIKANAKKEAEIRKKWREQEGLIYVREYTVKAHFRPVRKRRRIIH